MEATTGLKLKVSLKIIFECWGNELTEIVAIVKAKVVGDNCVIGPKVEVGPEISLSHNTVIWGAQNHTRIQVGTKEVLCSKKKRRFHLLVF